MFEHKAGVMLRGLRMSSRNLGFAAALSGILFLSRSVHADEEMRQAAHDYYTSEITSGYLFIAAGTLHAGAGVVALTQEGDFAKSFGWTSVVLGALTAIGGGGYGFTVAPRRKYFEDLAVKDRVRYVREETEHIQGTNDRFALYLTFEITETIVGAGVATYGFVKDKDVVKGIGLGFAIQGLSLLALDIPGALRAQSYRDRVTKDFNAKIQGRAEKAFRPKVGFAPGSGASPWLLSVASSF
jgi:hypothetical protein